MNILILAAHPSGSWGPRHVVHGGGTGLRAASTAAALLRAHGPIGPFPVRTIRPLVLTPSALRPGNARRDRGIRTPLRAPLPKR